MDKDAKTTPLYQNFDTTFVNIWSLLRNLTERGFIGRVSVDLPDYSAEVFLNGSATPLVREVDRAAGTETLEEGALHRLVLRARETPGTITVIEGAQEAATSKPTNPEPLPDRAVDYPREEFVLGKEEKKAVTEALLREPQPAAINDSFRVPDQSALLPEDIYPTGSYQDWPAILAASGELVGAVERAVDAAGESFGDLFSRVRLEVADDYSFLDPMSPAFDYAHDAALLKVEIPVNVYVSGLSESLRRCVNRVAVGDRARRVRERVALELLAVARRHPEVLERAGFRGQLDRIAGTRVM